MTRVLRLACMLLFVAPRVFHAAEAVKLRPLSAIDADHKGSGLKEPEGVAFDGKSILVIADTGNHRLLRYTLTGDRVTPAGEVRLNEIAYPIAVQVTSRGALLVLDGRSRRIARVSPTGAFEGYIQPAGGAAPGPLIPRSFKIDRQDDIYVLDVYQGRVLVLDPEGRARRQIAFPKGDGFLSDLAVDAAGTVFAIDSLAKRVFMAKKTDGVLSPFTSGMKEDMAFPTAIAVDDQGRIFVVDQNEGGVVILGADGSFRGRQAGMGWREGLLRYPSGLCTGGAGLLFVADRGNNRVQMFAVSE